ncbi:flagellar hook assembly protein FlgD [Hydrogenophaga sp.]|uniref:flagellar hook assembly protein FlgD n=1 Tax=Hydrogenophaga sp. TaxID=1904254 RepID=UPI00356AAE51
MQAIDLSGLSNTVGSSTNTAAGNSTDPAASQDRFLKLLVAQLNNQDPLNPMDNAQMTTQMAQINTVSGIQELNATLKGMSDKFSSMQTLQGTSLIGREALVAGSTLGFDGGVGKGAVALDGPAEQVYVDILGATGQVIDTIDMGALGAGQHAFAWDSEGLGAGAATSFKVRAANAGTPVTATPLTRLTVASVGFSGGALSLQLQDGRTLGYDQIRAFM